MHKRKEKIEESRKRFKNEYPRLFAFLLFIHFISRDPAKDVAIKLNEKSIVVHTRLNELQDLTESLTSKQQEELCLQEQKEYLTCEKAIIELENDLQEKKAEYDRANREDFAEFEEGLRALDATIAEKTKQKRDLLQEKSEIESVALRLDEERVTLTEQIKALRDKIDDLSEACDFADKTLPQEQVSGLENFKKPLPDTFAHADSETASLTETASVSTRHTEQDSEGDSEDTVEGRLYEQDSLSDSGNSWQTVDTKSNKLQESPTSSESSKNRKDVIPSLLEASMFAKTRTPDSHPPLQLKVLSDSQKELAKEYINFLVKVSGLAGEVTGPKISQYFYEKISTKSYLLLANADVRMKRLLNNQRYRDVNLQKIQDLQLKIQQIGIYREAGEALTDAMLTSLSDSRELIRNILKTMDKDPDFKVAVASMDINFDDLLESLDLTVKVSFMYQSSEIPGLQDDFARFELVSNPTRLQFIPTSRNDLGMLNYSFQRIKLTLNRVAASKAEGSSVANYAQELVADFSKRNDDIVTSKVNSTVKKLNEIYSLRFGSLRNGLPRFYRVLNASEETPANVARGNFVELSNTIIELSKDLEKQGKLDANLDLVEELLSVASRNLMVYLHASKGSLPLSVQKEVSKLERNLLEFHFNCGEAIHIVDGSPTLTRARNKQAVDRRIAKIETNLQVLSEKLPDEQALFTTVKEAITQSTKLIERSDFNLSHKVSEEDSVMRRGLQR